MRVSLKTKVVGLTLTIVLVGVAYIYLSQVTRNLKEKVYLKTAKLMQVDVQRELDLKSKEVFMLAVALGASEDIKKYFSKQHKTSIDFDGIYDQLTKYSLFEDIVFKVIPLKYDNNPLIKKPEIYIELPKTKQYIALKAIVPVKYNGSMQGYFSVKAIFRSIGAGLSAKKYKAVILMKDSEDSYVYNPFFNQALVNIVNEIPKNTFANMKSYIIKDGFLISTLKLDNINGNHQGYIVLAKALKNIDMSNLIKERERILLMSALVLGVFFLLLCYIYIVNYKKSLEIYSDELEKDLEYKNFELEKQTNILKFIAQTDPLTGLPNKISLINKLQNSIDNAKISDSKVGILFLDLDKFKEINDIYGHEAGDTLLSRVAQRLQECVKSGDVVARLSGDEFVIIKDKMTDIGIQNLAENILMQMKKPFLIHKIDIYITFSIGVSIYDKDGDTVGVLLKNAEIAMYNSKNFTKNNYKFYDESMTEFSKKRMELDLNIRNALKNNEFEPYYQPKVNALTNKVIGLETLIRWNDGDNGIISPSEFIPFCEETGLVTDVDKYMLTYAVRQVVQWQKMGIHTGKLSVNISTKKLESPNFVSELKQVLLSEQFNPRDLELEILEGQIMKDPETSIKILKSLRELGVSISIDDFGTGYSSLSYLNKLPITRLKIDRSFIIDVPNNTYDVALVKTIIAMATNLNLDIIAEGVETKEQVDFLVKEGCPNIQGYYFSKPLSAEKCKEYLREKS